MSGSSKPCIQAQTIASHTASQQQVPHCLYRGYECRQHANMQYNNVPHAHGLFVHATAASSGVCAPQAKKSGQIRPIYRGNALSASFRSVSEPEFKHAGLPLPTELTATPYSGCQSLRGSPWCRSTPKIAADLWQLIADPQEWPLCRQSHACNIIGSSRRTGDMWCRIDSSKI